ncbi:LysR family transcriptional regulator [Streptomyces sp. ST2-7A]|uniref:LysR family transcriptional regulator n=1 Tax=Streptomyces sp. ST2-7A TaxID=2907214 RepID=UPI0027E29D14|nr:LysR family transcriptional regulator [Streptomyces sp. ST2-7A]
MDLVGACRAFVHVSERNSFTVGAAAARMSQSVASRRVAALERHLGQPLFERGSRRTTPTPFGRHLLPAARRLVLAAESLEDEAERARRAPVGLAVPDTCPRRELARLLAEATGRGIPLDSRPGPPAERAELLASRTVRAALLAVPPTEATWTVRLGVAGRAVPAGRRLYVETLRLGRGGGPARRLCLEPEDDVPHVRDRLLRVCGAVGLRPSQLVVETSPEAAAARALGSEDLLVCSPARAREFGLRWLPVGEIDLVRGYALVAGSADDAERLGARLGEAIARCLGAEPGDSTDPAGTTVPPDHDDPAGPGVGAGASGPTGSGASGSAGSAGPGFSGFTGPDPAGPDPAGPDDPTDPGFTGPDPAGTSGPTGPVGTDTSGPTGPTAGPRRSAP